MTELIWEGKYKDGKKVSPLKVALPFQTVETVNETAQERQRALDLFAANGQQEWKNRLVWGDKKFVLPSLLADFAGKVDLIYIDPPFDTGANFAFTASVAGCEETAVSFEREPSAIEMRAYRDTWGRGLDSYLHWFSETATLLSDLLSATGSLYVHLDWHVAHYAKCLLDETFGSNNFDSEIIWKRKDAQSSSDTYGIIHDNIFFYRRGSPEAFTKQYVPLSEETADTWYSHEERAPKDLTNRRGIRIAAGTPRRFNKADISAPGPRVGTEAHYQWNGHWPPVGRH